LHPESEDVYNEHVHSHAGQHLGVLAAGALVFHSFLDGVGIGLAFHVSEAAGIIVAIAIIAHDFSDGMNTVALMLTHKNKDKPTITMLLADALAPVIGGVATLFVTIPQNFLLVYLSLFVGTLLYICTSEILPEAHRNKSSAKTLAMTVLGILFTLAVGLALAHSYS
jgi:ZIP family zinc transporter